MKKETAFSNPQPNEQKPNFNPVFMTLQVNIMNDRIIVQEYDNIPGQHANHRYEYDAIDDHRFNIEGDYHLTTKNMLVGIGQRLRQLQRYGNEREP